MPVKMLPIGPKLWDLSWFVARPHPTSSTRGDYFNKVAVAWQLFNVQTRWKIKMQRGDTHSAAADRRKKNVCPEICTLLRMTWLRMLGPAVPQWMQASAQTFNYMPHTSLNMSIMFDEWFSEMLLQNKSPLTHSLATKAEHLLGFHNAAEFFAHIINTEIVNRGWFMAPCSHHRPDKSRIREDDSSCSLTSSWAILGLTEPSGHVTLTPHKTPRTSSCVLWETATGWRHNELLRPRQAGWLV